RRPHPERREASRSACASANEVRAGHQPQNGESARPRGAADLARPRRRGDRMKLRKSDHITFVGSAVVVFLCTNAVAQEGHYGLGHDKWHESFYSTLKRDDGGSCCNLMDCRPTQSRMIGDHYEVKVDGRWMPVPSNKINNVIAPDGGAHVCAPKQEGVNKGVLFCVVLPPDG